MKILKLSLFLAAMGVQADSDVDLFAMSLEDLLNFQISTGSLEGSLAKNSVSAITVIRKEQIQNAPARNLAILLEQYVPGLIVMAHSQGDKIGVRGHIAAENYKLLLLINGKNVTNMVYEGVITEIDQWDLNDIERVEVIRGPGSVTYGTGAIAGVINIITKTAEDHKSKFSIGLNSEPQYQSNGFNLQYSGDVFDVKTYGYLSYRKTDGLSDPYYYFGAPDSTTDIRYIGKKPNDVFSAQDYLKDTNDRAQIKAHLDLNISEDWRAWARYTQAGQTHAFTSQIAYQDPQEHINRSGVSTRSFITSTDYQSELNKNANLKLSATFDTQEYIRYDVKNLAFAQDHTANIKDYAFSQNRFVANALYDYQFSPDLNMIIGYELNTTNIASPWGKSDDHLWIREGMHIISDRETSVYMQDLSLISRPNIDRLEEVGSGLNFTTHSNLLETSYSISSTSQVRYSHRIDFSNVTDTMYSPRLSLSSELDSHNSLVMSVQRSQRMMPLRAQYLFDKYYSDTGGSDHEEQDSLEVGFTNTSFENTTLNMRVFYNQVKAVGFTGDRLAFLNDSSLLGLEFEGSYKLGDFDFHANHTYLDALSVEMNAELKDGNSRNNISFSDYYYNTRSPVPILLEGYGDGLNNVPENVSKLYMNYKMLDGDLVAHVNAQIIWDLNGSLDEKYMYQQAYNNFDTSNLSSDELIQFTTQKMEFEREMQLLDKEDAFGVNINVSGALTYKWIDTEAHKMSVSLYAANIFDTYKRTYVSTGSNRYYPERLNFMKESSSFGLQVDISFK